MNVPPDRPGAEGSGSLSLDTAVQCAHQAFAEDLHQLVNCADQRFADVCWHILPSETQIEASRGHGDALTEARQTVTSIAAAGEQESQSLLYAHKALLFARAPQTFQRAFQILPSNLPSSESASASASASTATLASSRPEGQQSFPTESTVPGSSSSLLDTKFKRTHRHRLSHLRSKFPPSSFVNPAKSTHTSSSLADSDTESDHPTLSASTAASDTERESDSPSDGPGLNPLPYSHARLPTLKNQFLAQRRQLRPIPLSGASYDVLRDSLVFLYTADPEQAVAFDFLYNDHSPCSTKSTDASHSARTNLPEFDFGPTSISPDESPFHQLQLQEQLRGDLAYMWRSKLYADVSIVLDPMCLTSSSASTTHSHRPTSSIASTRTTVSTQSLPMDMEDENDDHLTFSAHRFMLATRSGYFAERLLSPSLQEEPSNITEATTILRLPPHPFSPIALHFTLGFLYTGSLTFSNRRFDLTTAVQILHAANFLKIPSLAPLVASMINEVFCHRFACVVPCSFGAQSNSATEPTSTAVAGPTSARRVRIQTNAGPQPDVEPQPGPCERCRRRVPKVLALTYTDEQCSSCARAQVSVSSAQPHGPHITSNDAFHAQLKLLRQAAQAAVTGPWFGAYWNKNIGNLPTEVRSILVRGVTQRVQSHPELVIPTVEQLTLLAHRLEHIASELAGPNKVGSVRKKRTAWIEHVHWMAQSVETTVQEVLATQLDAVVTAPSWDNLLSSHTPAAHETLDKVLVMLLDGLIEVKAPLAYQVLARPTVLHADPAQLDRLQRARGGVMRYLRRRWRAAVAVGGFQSLDLGALKEIVRHLGVKLEVLNPQLAEPRELTKSTASPTPTKGSPIPTSSSTKSMSMRVKTTTSSAQHAQPHGTQRPKVAPAQASTSKSVCRTAAPSVGTRSTLPRQAASQAGQAGQAGQAPAAAHRSNSRPSAPGIAAIRSTSVRSSRPSTAPLRSGPTATQPSSSASTSRATRARPPSAFTATARTTPTTVRSPAPSPMPSLGAQIPLAYRVPTRTESSSSSIAPSGRSSSLGSTTSSNTVTSTNTSTSNGSSVRVPGPPSSAVRSRVPSTTSTQSTQSIQVTKSTQPSAASNGALAPRTRRTTTSTTTPAATTTCGTQAHTPTRTPRFTSRERTIAPQPTSNEDKEQQKTPTTIRVRSSPSNRSSSDRTPRASHLHDPGHRTHHSVPDQDPTPTASRVYPLQRIESSESDSDSESELDGSQVTRRSGSPTPMATPRARQYTARATKSPTKGSSLAAKLGISPQRIDSPLTPGRRGNLATKDPNCARSPTTLKAVGTKNESPTLLATEVTNLLPAPVGGTVLYQAIPCVVAPSLGPATRGPPIARFKARVKYLGPVTGQEGTWVGVQVHVPVPPALLNWAWTRQSFDDPNKDGQDPRVLLSPDGTWAGQSYVPPSTTKSGTMSFAASARAVRVARASRNARIQSLLPGGSRPASRLSLTGSVSDASVSASASESEGARDDVVQRPVVFLRPEDVLYVETDL